MAKRPESLEESITKAAERFALDIMAILKTATIEEIAALKTTGAVDVAAAVQSAAGAAPEAGRAAGKRAAAKAPAGKQRKKRVWPTCSVDGCSKNVYMPSGELKMCYKHYIEAGGKESPLVRIAKERKASKQAAAGKDASGGDGAKTSKSRSRKKTT